MILFEEFVLLENQRAVTGAQEQRWSARKPKLDFQMQINPLLTIQDMNYLICFRSLANYDCSTRLQDSGGLLQQLITWEFN